MFEKINYYHHFQPEYLQVSWIEKIKDIVIFVDEILLGIVFLIYIVIILILFVKNKCLIKKYKKESKGNDKKYIVQRCYEDGFGYNKDGKNIESEIKKEKDKNGNEHNIDKNNEDSHRDYFYLVEKDGKNFYRIVNIYTLNKLGYPRPSRRPEKCFKLVDGYTIGKEIKIYNAISDIKDILKLKDKI